VESKERVRFSERAAQSLMSDSLKLNGALLGRNPGNRDLPAWLISAPSAVTLFVAAAHSLVLGAMLQPRRWDVAVFHSLNETWYDGAFFNAIANAPFDASIQLDSPPYRYQRILYPLLARALALGDTERISWTLLLITFGSVVAGTYILARLLKEWSLSPWYAATYGLFLGQFISIRFDTSEPLCFILVLLAIWAIEHERVRTASFCFALALLAKELALLFLLPFIAVRLARRQCRDAAVLTAAALPYALWQMMLFFWLKEFGFFSGPRIPLVPFGGFLAGGFSPAAALVPLMLLLPAVLAVCLAIWHWRGAGGVWSIMLLLNALLIIFVPSESSGEMRALARLSLGFVLATLLFGGRLRVSRVLNYSILWIPVSCIFIPSMFYGL